MLNVSISDLNPLHFFEVDPTILPQYNSRHILDFDYPDTVFYWQTMRDWTQPWQKSDAIRLQVLSEAGPVIMRMIDSYGAVAYTQNLQQLQPSFFNASQFVYQLDLGLSIFPVGEYRMTLEFGNPSIKAFMSNKFLVAETISDTLYFEYSHFKYYGDVYFDFPPNAFRPMIRLYGTLILEKPSMVAVVYPNQNYNTNLLSSKPYNTWRCYFGDSQGIPDIFGIKMNLICGCSELKIDGRYYTRATSNTQIEDKDEEGYPLRGWSIVLSDKFNRSSRKYELDPSGGGVAVTGGITAIVNVESKGFVSDDQGGTFHDVIDVE